MFRGSAPPTPERAGGPDASQPGDVLDGGQGSPAPDLATLPIAGLTRGRMLVLAGLFAAAWIIFAFARQIGAAGDLTTRADALRAGNAELESRIAELQAELELVNRPEYVALQAHAYRLGTSREIPFTLDPAAAALAPNAPGSALTAVGAKPAAKAPIEAWLTLLFAPAG